MFHYREASYQLILDDIMGHGCDGIERPDDAIEFAVHTTSSWIPLRITYGSESDALIRGFTVPATSRGAVQSGMVTEHVYICGDLLRDPSEIQFRWMGTADLEMGNRERRDIWALGNVTVNLIVENETTEIFSDSFGTDNLK